MWDGMEECSLRINQSVMYGSCLLAETFSWRIEGNKIRKERNYQSRRLYNFKEARIWIARNESLQVFSWDLINGRRDLMEWCGEFNFENRVSLFCKKWKHIKKEAGIWKNGKIRSKERGQPNFYETCLLSWKTNWAKGENWLNGKCVEQW